MIETETKNRRILVIDDNASVRSDFQKVLGSRQRLTASPHEALFFGNEAACPQVDHRFEVDTAAQGHLGLRRVQTAVESGKPYAVAFVDMRMPPGWDGVTTIEHLWEADPDLQVVICTAYSDHTWREIVDRLGEGDQLLIIKKPFDPAEVSQAALALSSKWDLMQVARNHTTELEEKVRVRTSALQHAHEETINCLTAALMFRDKETGAHIKRTGLYCEALAKELGWPSHETDIIRFTAPMHDVGKIGIPDAILLKEGRLSEAEFEIIKSHTIIGANLLSQSESPLLQRASEIALNHHERWDGDGYPNGLAGADIPLPARMLAIGDAFDAMSNDRVYRQSLSPEDVLQNLMEGRGTQFDPHLLDTFVAILPEMRRIVVENPDDEVGVCSNLRPDARITPVRPQLSCSDAQ